MDPEMIALLVTTLITLCGGISTIAPDSRGGKIMKIINVIGLNIGKAKNDKGRN